MAFSRIKFQVQPPELQPITSKPKNKLLKLLLQLAVTLLCFWYISKKIDFGQAWQVLLKANWWWLVLALLLYSFSKILASFRLNIYFRSIGLQLTALKNVKLYWLGMFYNLFLPGSISGDAYKVILLNKKQKAPYKKTTAAVLFDRFSGLLGLLVLLALLGLVVLKIPAMQLWLPAAAAAATLMLYFFVRRFFPVFSAAYWPTFFWGLAVQLVQALAVYCILISMGVEGHRPEWIFIFLFASMVAVLPLSLGGGLGSREFVFVEGAGFFHLDPQVGLVVSLLFYLITLISHGWGLYYIFHDPLKDEA